jgi:hypothetical protein
MEHVAGVETNRFHCSQPTEPPSDDHLLKRGYCWLGPYRPRLLSCEHRPRKAGPARQPARRGS